MNKYELNLIELPDLVLEEILRYESYDRISKLRVVSSFRNFNITLTLVSSFKLFEQPKFCKSKFCVQCIIILSCVSLEYATSVNLELL